MLRRRGISAAGSKKASARLTAPDIDMEQDMLCKILQVLAAVLQSALLFGPALHVNFRGLAASHQAPANFDKTSAATCQSMMKVPQ